jgi:surfeit locus 1 family protein
MQSVLGRFKRRVPAGVTWGLAGLAGYCLLEAGHCLYCRSAAEAEIAYRKKQLARPVYELGEKELATLPWNEANLRQWLYRPIKLTGRLIHLRQINIERRQNGEDGVVNIVPLVTHEDATGTQQYGVGLSRGWLPALSQWIENRQKVEYSD